MSSTIVPKVPHIHAEAIKQWADGAKIEYSHRSGVWVPCVATPVWEVNTEYRVKPELPAKVYPVTGMTGEELHDAFIEFDGGTRPSMVGAVNVAIRHAIDANEILTIADHQAAIAEFGEKLRDAASGREMAIAEAVRKACHGSTIMRTIASARESMCELNLAAIIAKVPTC